MSNDKQMSNKVGVVRANQITYAIQRIPKKKIHQDLIRIFTAQPSFFPNFLGELGDFAQSDEAMGERLSLAQKKGAGFGSCVKDSKKKGLRQDPTFKLFG